MNLLLTGGCGYIGSAFTQTLLALGHEVTVIDAGWHGCNLPPHPYLTLQLVELHRAPSLDLTGFDAIVHLAGITDAETASSNVDLVWETQVGVTAMLVEQAINAGVPHFIHCSPAALGGEHGRAIAHAERLLLGYRDELRVDIVRPGYVCGVSPRMRLDLPLNLYAMQALTRGRITVDGATVTAPHTHLRDLIRLFTTLLERSSLPAGVHDAGFETCTHLDLALRVAAQIPADIELAADATAYPFSSDNDSDVLTGHGFLPTYTLDDAIWEIAAEYRMGRLRDEERYYNAGATRDLLHAA